MPVEDSTIQLAEKLLRKHEGYRQFPYRCPAGKLTVGYGRNLEALGIRQSEAEYMLHTDVNQITDMLSSMLPFFKDLDAVRQAVLIDMAYQLGMAGLLAFEKMIGALSCGAWDHAVLEMMDSRWAFQTTNRARELADMMRTGELPRGL